MNTTEEHEKIAIASMPTIDFTDAIDAEFEELPEEPKKRTSVWMLILLCIVALSFGGFGGSYLYPLFFGHETITLYPQTETVNRNTTFTVPLQTLPTIQESQSKTVPTTGIVQQPASAASGILTFYNASLNAQTIDAGTMISAGSIKVVTDATVTIPAGTLATKGIASVRGHSLSEGNTSNILAGATYGACCKDNILVTNSAFYGGTDAMTYHTATSEDIAGVATSLKSILDAKTQKDSITQVPNNETLLPLQCSVQTKSSLLPGTAAEAVTITETETCTAKTYKASDLHSISNAYLITEAQKAYGATYQSNGDIQTSITNVSNNKIAVSLSENFSYALSSADQMKLKKMLAGKSKDEAQILIANLQGINKAQIEGLNTLPDASRIDIEIAR